MNELNGARYFLLFAGLFFFKIGWTQNQIIGKVLNAEQQRIQYATVIVNNEENVFVTGASTDENGSFQLSIEGEGTYKISVKYLGYSKWESTLDLNNDLDLGMITLDYAAKELDEVVVTAERTVLETKDDQLIFNVQSSPVRSGFDGMEVLQRAPNIWIGQNGEILLLNERATIWVNGRRTNMSGSELTDYIQSLPSEEIQKIEIQNNLSANMDGEQSGGLINIILRKKPRGFRSVVRANQIFRGEGFNRSDGGVNLNYGSQHWNIYGAYNLMQHKGNTDIFSEIFYNENGNYLENDQEGNNQINRYNYRFGFVAEAGRNHLLGGEISGNVMGMDFENYNILQMSNNQDILDKGTTDFTGETERNRFNANLNYSWTIPKQKAKLQIFADYAAQQFQTNNLADSEYELGFFPDTLERNDINSGTEIYALQADWMQRLSKSFKIETGLKWTITQRSNSLLSEFRSDVLWLVNDRSTDFEYDEAIKAAYFSGSKSFGETYFLRFGIRVEQTDLERIDLIRDTFITQNYTNWLPSITLMRKFSRNTSLSLDYSNRIRRPSFALLNNDVRKVNDFRYEIGNPDLAPEYVHNYAINFKHKSHNFRAYYTLTTDAINGVFFLEDDISFYQKINSGLQKQIGLRYNYTGDLKPWWFFKGSALVYHRKFTDPGGVDAFIQTTARFGMDHIFKMNKTTNFGLNAYYITPRTDAFYFAREHYAMNIFLSKSFFGNRLKGQIGLNDVFNTLVYANERDFTSFKTTNRRKPRTQSINIRLTYNLNSKTKVSNRKAKSKNEAVRRLE